MTRDEMIAMYGEDAVDRWLSCFEEMWMMGRTNLAVAHMRTCTRCGAKKVIRYWARVMFCVPCSYARAVRR